MEQLEGIDEGIHLPRLQARIEHDREQPSGSLAMAPPVLVTRRAGNRGMQHLRDLRLAAEPGRQRARGLVMGVIAHPDAGQRAQHQLTVVRGHADAQGGVRLVNLLVQCFIARHHRAHEHVRPARGVLGQRVHGDVHPDIKGVEGQTCPPGVVQGTHRTL